MSDSCNKWERKQPKQKKATGESFNHDDDEPRNAGTSDESNENDETQASEQSAEGTVQSSNLAVEEEVIAPPALVQQTI